MDLHPDFKDLLSAFADTNAEYLIVGGWAVGYHAEPRFTKDLDVFIGPSNMCLLERRRRSLAEMSLRRAVLDS